MKLPTIKATRSMMKMAAEDVLKREIVRYYAGSYSRDSYNIGLYMRCRIIGSVLKVAFFLTENMRSGGNCQRTNFILTGKIMTLLPTTGIRKNGSLQSWT